MAEGEEKPIRVVDRRMFTPDGELRADFKPEEEPEPRPASPPAPAAEPKTPGPPPASAPEEAREEASPQEAREPAGDFASLVRSLATTAYAALGLLPDPGGARRRDPAAARQMIDWLAMLEQKTRGNISFEESDFLSKILYDLRLAFVEATRPPAK